MFAYLSIMNASTIKYFDFRGESIFDLNFTDYSKDQNRSKMKRKLYLTRL